MSDIKGKYEISWPDIEEKIIKDFKDKMIYLEENESKRILQTFDGENYLIEGDNYYALSALTSTHREKIDVIYIDPPYNTGNKDFKYNDTFVDITDPWRHSKWLSFMHKRLFLARYLLKEDGVIFISIDDNEQAHLKLLCDEVFGEQNFINCIIWTYGKMSNESRKFANNHEYILVYGKSSESIIRPSMKKEDTEYKNRWPSYVKNNKIFYGDVKHKKDHLITKRKRKLEKLGIEICDDTVLFDFDQEFKVDTDVIYVPTLKGNADERVENILRKSFGLGQKPLNLIKRLITAHPNHKNVLILDFFAGSGTTGHAVLELNTKDNGNRKFILCTNNENNICTDICYPRIENVINGYVNSNGKSIKGIPSNLIYQKVKVTEEEYKGGKSEILLDKNKKKIGKFLKEIVKVKENTHLKIKLENDEYIELFGNKEKYNKVIMLCYGFSKKFTPERLDQIIQILSKHFKKNNINCLYYLPEEFGSDTFVKYNYPDDVFTEDLIIKDIAK